MDEKLLTLACSKCGYKGDDVHLAPAWSDHSRLCPSCLREEQTYFQQIADRLEKHLANIDT